MTKHNEIKDEISHEKEFGKEKGRPPGVKSIHWEVITDLAHAPLLGTVATMQSATPAVGSGVDKYSIYKYDPQNRGRRTSWSLIRFLYDGDNGQVAQNESYNLRRLHQHIKGTNPDGSKYYALNPKSFRIVPDTFLDGIIRLREDMGKPLTNQEKEQLYEEYVQLCLLFGIRRKYIAPDLETFYKEYEDTLRNEMTFNDTVKFLINYDNVYKPPKLKRFKFLQPTINKFFNDKLYPAMRISSIGPLHPLYRELHNIPWTEKDQAAYEKLCRRLQTFQKWVPRRLRTNPIAYLVRLGFRGPSLVTIEELERVKVKNDARKARSKAKAEKAKVAV